jgi:DNA-directed RNA polymerase specialized sigma24 family protein
VRWRTIRPHLDFLYDLALRETGRAQDAEDVVQEVAASALRAGEPERPRAYLAGAVLL